MFTRTGSQHRRGEKGIITSVSLGKDNNKKKSNTIRVRNLNRKRCSIIHFGIGIKKI
jgi:hypothetical protein